MKLIGILTSPYVRKTRIALSEKKIGYEFVLTDLSVPDNIATKFNPLGKVPCLVLDDGKTLYDSSVIVDYLDTLTPVNRLLPEDRHARTDVKCWEALADGIMDAAVLVRLEGKRPATMQNPDWIGLQTGKIHAGLKALSSQLGNHTFCLFRRHFNISYLFLAGHHYLNNRFQSAYTDTAGLRYRHI